MKPTVRHLFLATLVVAAWSTWSACPAGPTYQGEGDHPSCRTDEDCAPGTACSDQGACLPLASPASRVGIELVPTQTNKDSSTRLVQVEYLPDDLVWDDSGRILLTYQPPVMVEGSISVPAAPLNDEGFSQFETRLTLWRASRITGRPRVSYSTQLAFDMTAAPNDGSAVLRYELPVPAGFEYQARAVPDGAYDSLLPPSPDIILDLVDATQVAQFDYDFSQGDFLSASAVVTDAMGTPLGDIAAIIVDSQGRKVSTTAVSDQVDGSVTLLLSSRLPHEESYSLVLSPNSDSGLLLPKITVPIQFPQTHALDLGVIAYPPLRSERCTFQFRILGHSSSGTDEPVASAKVFFSTQFSYDQTGMASHEVETTTDLDGNISVALISGANAESRQYHVVVLPPVDSPYASAESTVEISGCGGASSTINLQARAQVSGTVLSVGQDPVANLTVLAKPVIELSSTPRQPNAEALMLQSGYAPSATTSQDGSFYLRLDQGKYDFEVTPPSASLFPRWQITSVTLNHDETSKQVRITMPSSALLAGQLRDPEGTPITGFLVRVYLVPPECAKGDWADCPQSAFLLGEGTLRPDGTFAVVIADSI